MSDNRDESRRETLDYLRSRHGEIYEAYEHYGRLVHEQGGPLEEKTRWLIKVAVTTTGQNAHALGTHVRKALLNGCTREEIEHAILLTAPSCGFPTMMEGLLVFHETEASTPHPPSTPSI